jgi:hypothetical protein
MRHALLLAAAALTLSALPVSPSGRNVDVAQRKNSAGPDSTVQASETSDERPVFDADIYDEETTLYAATRDAKAERTPAAIDPSSRAASSG